MASGLQGMQARRANTLTQYECQLTDDELQLMLLPIKMGILNTGGSVVTLPKRDLLGLGSMVSGHGAKRRGANCSLPAESEELVQSSNTSRKYVGVKTQRYDQVVSGKGHTQRTEDAPIYVYSRLEHGVPDWKAVKAELRRLTQKLPPKCSGRAAHVRPGSATFWGEEEVSVVWKIRRIMMAEMWGGERGKRGDNGSPFTIRSLPG
ncbi:hypothetical protein C8R43DRAFT_949342 [Mycena crocata]|nr:hypothetical protein C8R43DRAFT_949342 [Mycena crocata]